MLEKKQNHCVEGTWTDIWRKTKSCGAFEYKWGYLAFIYLSKSYPYITSLKNKYLLFFFKN